VHQPLKRASAPAPTFRREFGVGGADAKLIGSGIPPFVPQSLSNNSESGVLNPLATLSIFKSDTFLTPRSIPL
jgi:hypothetical protein